MKKFLLFFLCVLCTLGNAWAGNYSFTWEKGDVTSTSYSSGGVNWTLSSLPASYNNIAGKYGYVFGSGGKPVTVTLTTSGFSNETIKSVSVTGRSNNNNKTATVAVDVNGTGFTSSTTSINNGDNQTLTFTGSASGTLTITVTPSSCGIVLYSVAVVTEDGDGPGQPTAAATPTFNPVSGTEVEADGEIEINCTTENAQVYYTTDGTTPVIHSNGTLYTAKIPVKGISAADKADNQFTIKAIAYDSNGQNPSSVATANYTIAAAQNPDPSTGGTADYVSIVTSDFSTKSYAANDGAHTKTTENNQTFKYTTKNIYQNSSAMQWKNGSGCCLYNTESLGDIEKIEITASDFYMTVKEGTQSNCSNGTSITPTQSGNVYTFVFSAGKEFFYISNSGGTGKSTEVKIYFKGSETPADPDALGNLSVETTATGINTYSITATCANATTIQYGLTSAENVVPGTLTTYTEGATVTTTASATWLYVKATKGEEFKHDWYPLAYVPTVTLAEANALSANDPFVMGNNLVVTYANGAYVYVVDQTNNTVAGLIYKSGLNLNVNDVIASGWSGKINVYNGLTELVPDNDALTTNGTDETSVPAAVEISDAADFTNALLFKKVVLKNVEFDAATLASISQFSGLMGADAIVFYNSFRTESVAAGVYDVTAMVSIYNTQLQALPIAYTETEVVFPDAPEFDTEAGALKPYANEGGVVIMIGCGEGDTLAVEVTLADGTAYDSSLYEVVVAGDVATVTFFAVEADTNVKVTATATNTEGNSRSTTVEYTLLTRPEPATAGTYSFPGENTGWDILLYGQENTTGTINSVSQNSINWTATIGGVTLNVKNGVSTNGYIKAEEFRAYNGYTVTFTAPEGFEIRKIETAKPSNGKTLSDGNITSNPAAKELTIESGNVTWIGKAEEVVWTISNTGSFATIDVTIAEKTLTLDDVVIAPESGDIAPAGSVEILFPEEAETKQVAVTYVVDGETVAYPASAYTVTVDEEDNCDYVVTFALVAEDTTVTVTATATKDGYEPSEASATYTLKAPAAPEAATFDPESGASISTFGGEAMIMFGGKEGETLTYTVTSAGEAYTAYTAEADGATCALTFSEVAAETVITVSATLTNSYNMSTTATATYTLLPAAPLCGEATYTYNGMEVTVTVENAVSYSDFLLQDAEEVDQVGFAPTVSEGSFSFTITKTCTLQFKAENADGVKTDIYQKMFKVVTTPEQWTLVNKTEDLTENAECIIATKPKTGEFNASVVLSAPVGNSKVCPVSAATFNNDRTQLLTGMDDALVLTVNHTDDGYTLACDGGYLVGASNGTNLKPQETAAAADITFDNTNAVIKFGTRQVLYNDNDSSPRFGHYVTDKVGDASYSSVALYKKAGGPALATSTAATAYMHDATFVDGAWTITGRIEGDHVGVEKYTVKVYHRVAPTPAEAKMHKAPAEYTAIHTMEHTVAPGTTDSHIDFSIALPTEVSEGTHNIRLGLESTLTDGTVLSENLNEQHYEIDSAKSDNTQTGVANVAVDAAEGEYYNLNGVRIDADNLQPGLYIRRAGSQTTKVIIR